jgi:hypothetical protein
MASAVNYLLSLLSLCWLVSPTVDSANILALFPTASYSHQMPLLALPRALAQRGHNVTVITTNPLKVINIRYKKKNSNTKRYLFFILLLPFGES